MVDTIYALSSGRPPAGIAIIRISGPLAFAVNQQFCGKDLVPRVATLVSLGDPVNGTLLDRALALAFVGPHSATGENVVEWHCHGGLAVVQAVMAALAKQAGLREAAPGEFTRRAFENGRIDLNEAEGLADLLSAETETQRRSALAMAEGHFSRKVDAWRAVLLSLAARTEALLDFSDEDDVPGEGAEGQLRCAISALADGLEAQLSLPSAERIRDGIRVVIAGPPNAGKSTLLNALAGRDAAITSDIPGTTRDRIEVPVDLGGIAFVFTDTAGLRDATDDQIEAVGIERARTAVEQADIVLWLGSPDNRPAQNALCIATQIDRPDRAREVGHDLAISAVTGEGMAGLIQRLSDMAGDIISPEADYALHSRQRAELRDAVAALRGAADVPDMLIVAEHLRIARTAFDRLSGRAGVEDVLDTLFSRFCIGK